jgi:hypothetical protein
VAVILLITFGAITGFSIGIPFLLLGVLLLTLGPARHRPTIFWPIVIAYLAFITTYVLVAPLGCLSSGSVGGPDTTRCTNLLGLDYSGDGRYNPSLWPALLAGILGAAVAGAVARPLIRRARSTSPLPVL